LLEGIDRIYTPALTPPAYVIPSESLGPTVPIRDKRNQYLSHNLCVLIHSPSSIFWQPSISQLMDRSSWSLMSESSSHWSLPPKTDHLGGQWGQQRKQKSKWRITGFGNS
jgi:hypothetical protein